jgi:hypothetical protein
MSIQQQFERYLCNNEHTPVKRLQYKGVEIYISEGGPYPSTSEFPTGFYETAYTLGLDDKIVFWQPLIFDALHDIKTLTLNGRRQARINSAVKTARSVIDGEADFLPNYKIDAQEVQKMIANGEE